MAGEESRSPFCSPGGFWQRLLLSSTVWPRAVGGFRWGKRQQEPALRGEQGKEMPYAACCGSGRSRCAPRVVPWGCGVEAVPPCPYPGCSVLGCGGRAAGAGAVILAVARDELLVLAGAAEQKPPSVSVTLEMTPKNPRSGARCLSERWLGLGAELGTVIQPWEQQMKSQFLKTFR